MRLCYAGSCFPVSASKHSATKSLVSFTIELTKTFPHEITGVAPLDPGRGLIHAMFSVSLKDVGKSVSSV